MEKMTNVKYFEMLKGIKEVAENPDLVAFLDKWIARLSKKRTTKTKVQIENEGLVEDIYAYMVEVNEAVTVSDVMAKFDLASNQKASALIKKLVDAKRVVRSKDGKKTIYTIAD